MRTINKKRKVESPAPRPNAGPPQRVGTYGRDGASRGDSRVSRHAHLRPKTYLIVVSGEIPTDLSTRISAIHAAALLKTTSGAAYSPKSPAKSKNSPGLK